MNMIPILSIWGIIGNIIVGAVALIFLFFALICVVALVLGILGIGFCDLEHDEDDHRPTV